MTRIAGALIAGVVIGAITVFAIDRSLPTRPAAELAVRDIVDVPKMTEAVAEDHRKENYENLTSIVEVMALPTEFARTEAMFVLAGRADAATVQALIFDANRIADDVERATVLGTLFFRLAESDPESALALARTDFFKGTKSIERTVWRAWARNNLDEALEAAKAQITTAHRNSAAQSLYAAFGYMGNETTDRIEAELGIGPDRSSRGRYLYALADKSPAEAIAFINELEHGTQRQEYVSWLAYYLSLRDPSDALRYTDLLTMASDRERFRAVLDSNIVRENPRAALDRMMANGRSPHSSSQYYNAIRALVSTDLEAAQQYYDQARTEDQRQAFGSMIAAELAKTDPQEALEWARQHDKGEMPYLRMSVLTQLAQTDPQLAIAEAMNTPDSQKRSILISSIVQHVARTSPEEAVAFLDQIDNRQQKVQAAQQLATSWIRYDADAAVTWMLNQEESLSKELLSMASRNLVRSDIDAAIRLLPRLDDSSQSRMRLQIAESLATHRSPDEAWGFIRQFEGQAGYDMLQASVIGGVAQTDAIMAKNLADQLVDGAARDRAYVTVISEYAKTDPVAALRWLDNVQDEAMRGNATGQLVGQWYEGDPASATRWVNQLPPGSPRDDAILQMSYRWRTTTAEQEKLIASIRDRDKRGQAKIRRIYNIARTDPEQARRLLEDEDIPSHYRQQAEQRMLRYGSRF